MKTWFNFKALADDAADVSIHDEIGMWGVSAKDFIDQLQAHKGKAINLSINSPGGSVFDGLAMYNALRSHGNVTVRVLGVAASAASLVAMAGDKIIMPENTFLMIHNPWAFAAGNADELRDFADTLDTIGSSLVKTYVARTGLPEDEIKQMLDAETWLTAEEAVAKGFATEVEAALKIAASYDVERFPENVRAVFASVEEPEGEKPNGDGVTNEPEGEEPSASAQEPNAPLADEIAAYAATVGMSDYAASVALSVDVKSLADAKARLDVAREVVALCTLAGVKDMAQKLIKDSVSIDDARAMITDALAAKADEQPTSSIKPSGTDKASGAGADVWSKIFPKPAAKKE